MALKKNNELSSEKLKKDAGLEILDRGKSVL